VACPGVGFPGGSGGVSIHGVLTGKPSMTSGSVIPVQRMAGHRRRSEPPVNGHPAGSRGMGVASPGVIGAGQMGEAARGRGWGNFPASPGASPYQAPAVQPAGE